MHAQHAVRIFSRRACLGAKTRGPCRQPERQAFLLKDVLPDEIVSGTSAVGISQYPLVVRKRSSSNFGNWPVPNAASARTRSGGEISLYPNSRVCKSSMKLPSARSSRARVPVRKTNLAPETFAARSKSICLSFSPS